MGYKDIDGLSDSSAENSPTILQANGETVDLPDATYVRDADMVREGMDLVLEGPEGTVVVEGYFAAEPAPNLVAPNGDTLTPDLVESFARSPSEFANAGTMSDVSPVGAVDEVSGEATIMRADGSVDTLEIGTPVFQGDIIETSGDGAVNIVFADDTSFAVSEDARLAIDEYVYDPSSESGSTEFSVLKGVFVFTSGLIGRDDPDDVAIDTPMGSIGIRGTTIVGDVDEGTIMVTEGAIVMRDPLGNEMTFTADPDGMYDIGRFMQGGGIENAGQMSADDMGDKFASVAKVAPSMFTALGDGPDGNAPALGGEDAPEIEINNDGNDDNPADDIPDTPDGEGSVDDDGDGDVDGTVADDDAQGEGGEAPVDPDGEPVDGAGADPLNPDAPGDAPPPPPPPGTGMGGTTFGTGTGGMGPGPLPPGAPPPPPPGGDGTTTATAGDTNVTGDDPVTPPDPNDPQTDPNANGGTGNDFKFTVLGIDMSIMDDQMLSPGHVLGTIQGQNGDIASVQFIGPLAGLLDYVPLGGNQFDIVIKSGIPPVNADFDFFAEQGIPFGAHIKVTSTTSETFTNFVNVPITPDDEDPLHTPQAPNEFFKGAEGLTWTYHFDKDFVDTDFGDNLTYVLGGTTQAMLGSWAVGGGSGYDVLDNTVGQGMLGSGGDENQGWTFDEATGELILFFNNTFNFTPGMAQSLVIDVDAMDAAGQTSTGSAATFQSYLFDAINDTDPFGNLNGVTNQVIVDMVGGPDSITIASGGTTDNNTVFMGAGDDMVTMGGSPASGNTIYLGQGDNTVISGTTTATGNTFIGGDDLGKDTFLLGEVQNKHFGMDGDDDFVLNLSSGVNTDLETPTDPNTLIDGGWSDFRAGLDVQGAVSDPLLHIWGNPGGRGDSLVLQGPGSLDFTMVDDNYIRGIERIDATGGGYGAGANVITLNYMDIMQMTDSKNVLIINLEGGDVLNLNGPEFNSGTGNFEKVLDDFSIDDARQGDSPDMKDYDVFTDGNVTLLIHDVSSGSATVNFDGTGVTI